MNDRKYTPMGHQALVPTTSTSLTVPKGAKFAFITSEVQACRMTDDGTTPTLAIGLPLKVTDPPFWYSGDLHAVRLFNAVGGALVTVLYYS
jgi:hypothetical protein